MNRSVLSKTDVKNVILAAQKTAGAMTRRSPDAREMCDYLDGFATALEVIALGLGIDVVVDRAVVYPPELWRETRNALPASVSGPAFHYSVRHDGLPASTSLNR